MRIIRASEIGSFLYCNRAWWYRKKGIDSENQAEMATGTSMHYQHSRQVAAAGCLRSAAAVCILGALALVAMHYASQVVTP